jgi:hypothetical protein
MFHVSFHTLLTIKKLLKLFIVYLLDLEKEIGKLGHFVAMKRQSGLPKSELYFTFNFALVLFTLFSQFKPEPVP